MYSQRDLAGRNSTNTEMTLIQLTKIWIMYIFEKQQGFLILTVVHQNIRQTEKEQNK